MSCYIYVPVDEVKRVLFKFETLRKVARANMFKLVETLKTKRCKIFGIEVPWLCPYKLWGYPSFTDLFELQEKWCDDIIMSSEDKDVLIDADYYSKEIRHLNAALLLSCSNGIYIDGKTAGALKSLSNVIQP